MALNKSFRLFHKLDPPGSKYSVILEERNIEESLLFESRVVGILSPSEVDSLKKTCNYTRYCPSISLSGEIEDYLGGRGCAAAAALYNFPLVSSIVNSREFWAIWAILVTFFKFITQVAQIP